MLHEQNLFLNIVSEHLHKKNSPSIMKGDIEQIVAFSMRHELAPIIFYQTHIYELNKQFLFSVFCATIRQRILDEIHAAFLRNNIRYLIFKGSEIAQFYPIPQLRTMGDIDILVHFEDKEKAHELLRTIGCHCNNLGNYEWYYKKGNIEIELHHALIYEKIVSEQCQRLWADQVWKFSYSTDNIQYHLELEYHLVYLLTHICKHLMNSGIGFRQFLDIAVIAKQDVDWSKVERYLIEARIKQFAIISFSLIDRWFGVSTPYSTYINDEFYNIATESIFKNGLFGCDNDENERNAIINRAHKEGRLCTICRSIFPRYKEVRRIKKYSYIDGKPWLLPMMWGHRFFRAICDKRAINGLKDVEILLDTEKIMQRKDYLRQWGLIE